MKFTIVLNADIPLQRLMNALAQMSFGLGHRIQGVPDVEIFFADTPKIRAFRTLAQALVQEHPDQTISTDFPHTMVGASNAELLDRVVSTPEADVTYYGACFLSEHNEERLNELTQSFLQLVGYVPFVSTESACKLLPAQSDISKPTEVPKKITMVLNKLPLAKVLNDAVLANLSVGAVAAYDDQYLLNIGKSDEGCYRLTNVSFHSNIIAKTDLASHKAMSQCAEQTSELSSATRTSDGIPSVTVVFGDQSVVERVIPKAKTRLFSDALGKKALVPVSAAHSHDKPESFRGTHSLFPAVSPVSASQSPTATPGGANHS